MRSLPSPAALPALFVALILLPSSALADPAVTTELSQAPPPTLAPVAPVAAQTGTRSPVLRTPGSLSGLLGTFLIPLRVMLAKGIITQAEYDGAMKDLADTTGLRAADQVNFVYGKWSTGLYGFVEGDYIYDTTQSYTESPGNTQIARGGTYAGDHPRMQFSPRFSRIGFRMRAPESHGIRASALVEADFLQSSAASSGLTVASGATSTSNAYGSEQSFYTNPVLRIRHMYLRAETPVADFLFGQYWQLFGWQPLYMPATTQIQGMPGEIFSRTPQFRVSKTVGANGPVTFEIALSAARPPQRDSAVPEGEAGMRLSFNRWRGMYTSGSTNTALAPMSVAVTGDLRHVALPEFAAAPPPDVTVKKNGSAIAANLFAPIVPADEEHKGNSLSIVGQFAYGYGIADLFTSLTGGVGFPPLPNPPAAPAVPPVYSANIDPGIVTYDGNGNLHFIQWLALLGGVQYYLPGLDGKMFVSASYSHMESPNTRDYFGSSKSVTSHFDWWDATVMGDVTDAIRLGIEYASTRDAYLDGTHATNLRGQVSAWYIY